MPTPQEMVDAIDAAIGGTLTANQQSYSINGRSLTRIPLRDLIEARKHFVSIAASESGSLRPAIVRFGRSSI